MRSTYLGYWFVLVASSLLLTASGCENNNGIGAPLIGGAATPSKTPTATPTKTPTATPSPAAKPSVSATPTATATATPTVSASPT